LPNITGSMKNSWSNDRGLFEGLSGCFYSIYNPGYLTNIGKGVSSSNPSSKVGFDASRCNPIYGKIDIVQPATCKCYFIIKY